MMERWKRLLPVPSSPKLLSNALLEDGSEVSVSEVSAIDARRRSLRTLVLNPFSWLLLLSAGIHSAFWLLAPNPLPKSKTPQEIAVKTTLPVVNLPPQKQANSTSINPQAAKPASPQTVALPPAPPALVAPPLSRLPVSPRYLEGLRIEALAPATPRVDALDLDRAPNLKPDVRRNATEKEVNSRTDKLAVQRQLERNASLEEPANPSSASSIVLGENAAPPPNDTSNKNTNLRVASASPAGALGDETVSRILSEYAGRIVIRRIAPSTALVVASQREPGVDWIPPIERGSGKTGTVEVALLVNPSGVVEKRLMRSSGVRELDRIVEQTIEGYYDKFRPLEGEGLAGKYRYVTIRYEFPVPSP